MVTKFNVDSRVIGAARASCRARSHHDGFQWNGLRRRWKGKPARGRVRVRLARARCSPAADRLKIAVVTPAVDATIHLAFALGRPAKINSGNVPRKLSDVVRVQFLELDKLARDAFDRRP